MVFVLVGVFVIVALVGGMRGLAPRTALTSGVLATGGDVFYGTIDGWFKAIDARTGSEPWKLHAASGIVANWISDLGPFGKRYIAVYPGIGGLMGASRSRWIS